MKSRRKFYTVPAGALQPGMTIAVRGQTYIITDRVNFEAPGGDQVLIRLGVVRELRAGRFSDRYRGVERLVLLDTALVDVHIRYPDLPFCDLVEAQQALEHVREHGHGASGVVA